MNERERMRQRTEEAVRWYVLCQDDALSGRKFEFVLWLRCRENMVEYLRVAELISRLGPEEFARCRRQTLGANIVLLSDHLGRRPPFETPSVAPQAVPESGRITRRGLLAAAAGFSGVYIAGAWITSAPTRLVSAMRSDVIKTGHVLRVLVPGGVMHLARNSSFRIDGAERTIHVLAGQAAFELARGVQSITRVTTPFGEIAVAAARFGVVVLKSMAFVSVAEGDVRIHSSASPAAGTHLTAGRKLTLQHGVAHSPVVLANAQRELAWTQGDLYFTDETFGQAAAAFNRFNTLQIRPSPTVAGLPVGIHHCSLSDPQRFVDRLLDVWGLASRKQGEVIHIFRDGEAPESR